MSKIEYFNYGQEEVEYLKKKDSVLASAIDEIGQINREIIPYMFMAVVNSIIGQQISTKAQATIWKRMLNKFSIITPETIAVLTEDELQSIGISFRKASYIKGIAESIISEELDLVSLENKSDNEVCKYLSQIKGIGVWTAEMLMIFSMQRPNIISINDIAILRGLRMLYHHRKITPKLFAKYKKRYSPYATVASLYLWEIASGACKNLVDYAPITESQKRAKSKKENK